MQSSDLQLNLMAMMICSQLNERNQNIWKMYQIRRAEVSINFYLSQKQRLFHIIILCQFFLFSRRLSWRRHLWDEKVLISSESLTWVRLWSDIYRWRYWRERLRSWSHLLRWCFIFWWENGWLVGRCFKPQLERNFGQWSGHFCHLQDEKKYITVEQIKQIILLQNFTL